MRAALLIALVGVVGCSSGEEYAVGGQATAAVGVGKVTALYGKLVELEVAGSKTWVLGSTLDPAAKELEVPETDKCAYPVGSRVRARADGARSRSKGTVVEVHGVMGFVLFDTGKNSWRACEKMRGKAFVPEGEQKKPPVATGTGGEKDSGGYKKCVYRPEKGKHVMCSTFTGGKCRFGSKSCKPASKCVFRPDKGKYVKCSTFSAGKCKSGTVACKPRSKCVYRPDKGKYVRCSTFTAGKCKTGSVACKP